MQNEANFPARAAERDRNGTHGSTCSRLIIHCDNGTNGQCTAWAMKQLGGRISGPILKAARKFWDRPRLREWMEPLILTQAWNQESLKDGRLNSSFFCAPA